ncbi:PPE family protein [Mycobacterium celatum]|uniref:PPE family protein n=1 Tax=Mycobacterium celatum TaxID=28045 RepID=A0A1X1RTY4_MYCCE|nr:PPE family protein [Mycobacterium celatum]ORV17874.1 hypothetical protein AWB95_05995 [Mycobacterium celatum]PIB74145.1 PPE family protein [Mycobacterium celatum]
MDFGALPPEINSARMYAGPGSAPMLAAASAWDGLAAELRSTAASYQSVIAGLTSEGWLGPSSAAMAAATARYATWMSTTAEQAEQTAAQATAAAAAHAAAFAMTVPPPVIAANRAQLATLVATNVLGQNTPAIAATEAQYGEMWAQDAAAMYGYAANSAAASKMTPFRAPPNTINPGGLLAQEAAPAQAAGTSTQSQLSQLVSAMPTALQQLASPTSSASSGSGLSGILDSPDTGGLGPNANIWNTITSSGATNPAVITSMMADMAMVGSLQQAGALPPGGSSLIPGPGMGSVSATRLVDVITGGAVGSPATAPMSAGIGQARLVGALSVPQSWAAAAPVSNSTVTPFPGAGWTAAAPDVEPGGMPGMPGMPMAGLANGRGFGFAAPRYGFKPTVMGRPVIAG